MSNVLLDAITRSITEDCIPEGAIVTSFVVIAEVIDSDGESVIFTETMENQRCHVSLGLLEFAGAIERRRAAEGL